MARLTVLLSVFYAALAVIVGLGAWWPFLRGTYGLTASLAAVHREAGDIQYYPLIAGLSKLNFGENAVLEEVGRNIQSFPFSSIFLHAVCVRLFGEYGWLVADITVAILYYLLGRWLLIELRIPARWASLLSITLLFACAIDATGVLYRHGFPAALFPNPTVIAPHLFRRIPRPYVTDLFVLLALVSFLRLCLPRPDAPLRERGRDAILGGFAVTALLQANIHVAAGVLPMGMLACAARFVWEVTDKKRRVDMLKLALLFAGAFLIFSTPFLVQRLFESPDVPRRFGVYEIARSRARITPANIQHIKQALISAAVFLLPLCIGRVRRASAWRRGLSSVGLLFVIAAGSALSRPVFIVLTGTMVQEYQFGLQFERTYGMAFACAATLVGYHLGRFLLGRARPLFALPGWRRLIDAAAIAGTIGAGVLAYKLAVADYKRPLGRLHVRSDFFHYKELGDAYLNDLQELTAELQRRSSTGLRVLATLDHEVMAWWVALQGGYMLNPDPFSSTLPDSELEKRLVALGAALNLSSKDFIRWLTQDDDRAKNNSWGHNNIIVTLFFSHQKYGGRTGWHLNIPNAELRRLRRLYEDTASESADRYRVDGIVLFSRGCLADLSPDPERFEEVFKNSTFRLYVTRPKASPSGAAALAP
jgi:hypothetical protein